MNQCVCSQLLPAALSLIGGASPLQPDVLRPALSFITSCIANNGEVVQLEIFLYGEIFAFFHPLLSWVKSLSCEFFCPNDYVEPMVIFTVWAKF